MKTTSSLLALELARGLARGLALLLTISNDQINVKYVDSAALMPRPALTALSS